MFRGREITHLEFGWKLLRRMTETLKGAASIDRQPMMEGRRMNVVLAPAATQKAKIEEEVKESQHAQD